MVIYSPDMAEHNVSSRPDDMSHYMQATSWYRSVLRDVAFALRHQEDLTREQIAQSIDRALEERTPYGD